MSNKTFYEVTQTTRDQTSAAFIDMLKQIRLDNLLKQLSDIQNRQDSAQVELEKLRSDIIALIDKNRGGIKGIHGFIGERVQVVFSNSRAIIQGKAPLYQLLDNNGMTDYLRGDVLIQQKACISDKELGLSHILCHATKYPAFLDQDGVYQIPKDFYETYVYYMEMPHEAAGKLLKAEYRLWQRIHAFHDAAPDIKIEPMVVTYNEIQAGAVMDTIENESKLYDKKCQEQSEHAKYANRATLKEGLKVTAASAAIEGIVDGGISLAEHTGKKKKIQDLDKQDWSEIGIDVTKGLGKGAIRGAVTYTATNILNVPAPIASASVTAAFSAGKEIINFKLGKTTKKQFGYKIAEVIADTVVCSVSALIGKKIIRNPVIGALVGNAVGTLIWHSGKNALRKDNSVE